jgi:hypothetical protein
MVAVPQGFTYEDRTSQEELIQKVLNPWFKEVIGDAKCRDSAIRLEVDTRRRGHAPLLKERYRQIAHSFLFPADPLNSPRYPSLSTDLGVTHIIWMLEAGSGTTIPQAGLGRRLPPRHQLN